MASVVSYPDIEAINSEEEQSNISPSLINNMLVVGGDDSKSQLLELKVEDVIHDKTNSSHNSVGVEGIDQPNFTKAMSTLVEELDANNDNNC